MKFGESDSTNRLYVYVLRMHTSKDESAELKIKIDRVCVAYIRVRQPCRPYFQRNDEATILPKHDRSFSSGHVLSNRNYADELIPITKSAQQHGRYTGSRACLS